MFDPLSLYLGLAKLGLTYLAFIFMLSFCIIILFFDSIMKPMFISLHNKQQINDLIV